MDLVLDFQTAEGEPWRSVLPGQAKKYASAPRNERSGMNFSMHVSMEANDS